MYVDMQKKEVHKEKLLRSYLLVTFFYGLLGFLDALFFSKNGVVTNINTYHYLAAIVFFTFLGISILALIFFIQAKLPRITYVLPVYTIANKVLIVLLAFAWTISLARANVSLDTQEVPNMIISIAIIFSLFECLFSVYLLRKFDLV